MISLCNFACLLAQGPRFSDLGRNFRDGGAGLSTGNLIFAVTVVVGVTTSVWLLSRWLRIREERGFNNPRALFRELCQAHGLERTDRRLLKSLARAHRLDHPSRLFLEPDRFDVSARPGAETLAERARLESLRDRIFGCRLHRRPAGAGK